MTYTSPATIDALNPMSIFYYLNIVTDGWFSNMILISCYILVIFGYYKARDDFSGAMAVAGFMTFLVAMFFWIANFTSAITLSITIAMAIIGVAVLLITNE